MPLGPSLDDLINKKSADEDSTEEKLQKKIIEITRREKEEEIKQQADSQGLPYINLSGFAIGPDAISLIDPQTATTNQVVSFFYNGTEIRLATTNYTDSIKELEQTLAEEYHANVSTYLISQYSLNLALKIYDTLPKIKKSVAGIEIKAEELKQYETEIKTFKDLDNKIKQVSTTELITLLMAGAIKSRASDIHIEAEEKGIKIRYRIDGVLNDVATIEKRDWPKIASRIKHLAKLKINISDRPQDGRFSVFLTNDRIDLRVSALPTAFGESIVIRLLMSSAVNLSFEDLGLRGGAFQILEKEIQRPNGMIVTTGPTGSGKTTTLYAILKKLNKSETKIITIEDPIEYELKGINQSQVNKDYTFAKGLRSIVRQDPDIIMVGEIRDLDTAEIAIQAALTGHLVLSTIHTNDAFGAIPRFLSMGVKPFLLAPALNVAIGQRLVRRICDKCKTEIELSAELKERVSKLLSELPNKPEYEPYKKDIEQLKFYQGAGCENCQGLGYKGRIGIYEIMPIDGEIENKITKGDLSEYEIKALAKEKGVVTMAQDGLLKALDGITSVEEVFRVSE